MQRIAARLCIFLVFMLWAEADGQTQPSPVGIAGKNIADTEVSNPLPNLTLPYAPNCAAPAGREDADFCVQQRMADATEKAVTWSQWQAYSGIGQIFGLIVTLIFSAIAAIAAISSAKIARKTLDLEARGYLFLNEFLTTRAFITTPDQAEHRAFRIIPKWENMGRGPAIITQMRLSWSSVDQGQQPSDVVWGEPTYPAQASDVPMGPGAKNTSMPFDMGLDLAHRIQQQQIHFFLLCRLEYRGMHDQLSSYHTQIGAEVNIHRPINDLFNDLSINIAEAITFTAIGEFGSIK